MTRRAASLSLLALSLEVEKSCSPRTRSASTSLTAPLRAANRTIRSVKPGA